MVGERERGSGSALLAGTIGSHRGAASSSRRGRRRFGCGRKKAFEQFSGEIVPRGLMARYDEPPGKRLSQYRGGFSNGRGDNCNVRALSSKNRHPSLVRQGSARLCAPCCGSHWRYRRNGLGNALFMMTSLKRSSLTRPPGVGRARDVGWFPRWRGHSGH